MRRIVTQLALALGGLALAAGCQHLAPEAPNALLNPGFEDGREGWSWRDKSPYWSDFQIAEEPVRRGTKAAHLSLRHEAGAEDRPVAVFGVVQELPPEIVPEVVGGWVRVERWEKGSETAHLYLQLVAIVWGDPRTPRIVFPQRPPRSLRNFQLRYYLWGAERPAFRLGNGRVIFVTHDQPPLGEWLHFEVPLREDLMRYWQVVPEGHERISLLFEARWDNLRPGETVAADVFFDDLYAR